MDYNNNRVMRYSAANAAVSGSAAEAAFGQADLNSNATGTSATLLNNPMACAITDTGDLWITDSANGRALLYTSASTKATGAAADLVLGQANMTAHSNVTLDQSTLANKTYGIAVTPNGSSLWVSSTGQNRVLRWDNPASKSNGAAADGVLGQANFTSGTANQGLGAPTAATLSSPTGLTVDASGNLYVLDQVNKRVLRYNSAASKANGADADGVLGVANFTSQGAGTVTASTIGAVDYSITVASDGKLYHSSYTQNRILIFNTPSTSSGLVNADNVLGQSLFTTNASPNPPTAASLNGPLGLGFNPLTGYFYVGDYLNNRVVAYSNPELIAGPTLAATTAVSSIGGSTAQSGGNITSDGGAAVTARGVCWNTTGAPTIADSKTTDGAGTGVFTSTLTGLTANTTYYVRAYATNSNTTSYGSQVSFTTTAAVPAMGYGAMGLFALLLAGVSIYRARRQDVK